MIIFLRNIPSTTQVHDISDFIEPVVKRSLFSLFRERGYIDNIKSASSYAGDLVAQMLIFSQKGNEKLTRCRLEDSLNDVLESLSYELSANISVEIDIQESEEVAASIWK